MPSDLDPRLLSLLSLLGKQDESSQKEDASAPFGMPAGPALNFLRSMSPTQALPNFIGTPPSVGTPMQRVSGDEASATPSRLPRSSDLNVSPRRMEALATMPPMAFGAMPNSSLEPAVVQRALMGDQSPETEAPRRAKGEVPSETVAPKEGGFPDIRIQPTPSLISAFPQMSIQPIPGMVSGFQDQPRVQGAPQMPQMGFPQGPGAAPQAPMAALAGLPPEQQHQMLAALGMPAMGAMATGNLSALAGGGGGASGGASSQGLRGTGTGTGTGASATHSALPALVASLIPGLLKALPLSAIKNLIGNTGLGDFGPAGTVGGYIANPEDPMGGPLGTGASTNTAPDTLLPTYGAGAPEDFPNEFDFGNFDNFHVGPTMDVGSPDLSALDLGGLIDDFGGGGFW